MDFTTSLTAKHAAGAIRIQAHAPGVIPFVPEEGVSTSPSLAGRINGSGQVFEGGNELQGCPYSLVAMSLKECMSKGDSYGFGLFIDGHCAFSPIRASHRNT